MSIANISESLLNRASLAELLNLSKRQISRLKAQGKLPKALKIGGSVRWKQTDIHKWLDLGCPCMKDFEARKEG